MTEPSTTRGEPVRQFSVFMPNRVGAMLGIVKMVNESLAEVLGMSLQDSVDGTVARMVVSDADAVETLFIEKGIPHATSEIVVVELGDASFFGDCLTTLLEAETNVHFCYSLMSRPNGRPTLAFYLDDLEFGRSILSANGFKVLYQNDLSR
ncbi:MAG: acetolactate synthase [Verrucomicrobiales bacterium]|nr:acetolactate synthase [Verrucomicrobiales bacterium]